MEAWIQPLCPVNLQGSLSSDPNPNSQKWNLVWLFWARFPFYGLLVWYDFASGVPNRSSCSWKHCSQGHWGTRSSCNSKKRVHSHAMVRITKLTRVSDTDFLKKTSIHRSVLSLTLTQAHGQIKWDSSRGWVLSPWLIRVQSCKKTSRSSCSHLSICS